MGKQTRANFLVTMGSLTLAALSGCAGGAPPDSRFQKEYRAVYNIPASGEVGLFNFSIAQKGEMLGELIDSNSTQSYAFNGTVTNNGKFQGELVSGATKIPIQGTLSDGGGDFEQVRGSTRVRGNFTVGGTLSQTVSEYQGLYNGVFNIPGPALSGQTSFTVDRTGKIIGLMARNNETGQFTGTVTNTGQFAGNVVFTAESWTLAGTLVKTTDSTSKGNFNATVAGKTYPATFGPSTVRAGDSPYNGSYRGTYGVPEQGENGSLSFTVDPAGTITGFFSQTNNEPVGTFTGAFNNDGTFAGQIVYDPGLPAPYDKARPIVGKMAESAGGSGVAGDFVITIGNITRPGNFEAAIGASEVNSIFRAAYTDNGWFPFEAFKTNAAIPGAPFLTSSISDFAVDKQGSIVGVLGTHVVDGRITNDGRMVGRIVGTDGVSYRIRGIINKVVFTFRVGDKEFKIPGVSGNLLVTVGGADYPLSFKSAGGDGVTTGG